jgi:rare lipoprotein A
MKTVAFIAFVMVSSSAIAETGIASWYSGRGVACRGMHVGPYTAAHRSAPCGSRLRVTNTHNGRSIVVTIVDRGPYIRGRIIDLRREGAAALGMDGVADVSVERVGD